MGKSYKMGYKIGVKWTKWHQMHHHFSNTKGESRCWREEEGTRRRPGSQGRETNNIEEFLLLLSPNLKHKASLCSPMRPIFLKLHISQI
jgi:hypothetical protein